MSIGQQLGCPGSIPSAPITHSGVDCIMEILWIIFLCILGGVVGAILAWALTGLVGRS